MRRSSSIRCALAALALVLSHGCDLSMAGKDACNGAGDCLDGYTCFKGRCVLTADCPVTCGDTCCEASQRCDSLTRQCLPGCVPQCKGRQCGDDRCGGSCGDCGKGWTCNAATSLCETCQPNCTGKQCGSDGCGRTCGTCASWETCNAAFVCVNAPRDAGVVMADAGGGPSDAGSTGVDDAGVVAQEDGGLVAPDDAGGEPPDAGWEERDAAVEPGDAGGGTPDAAFEPLDGGSSSEDAATTGPPDADLGPPDASEETDAEAFTPDAG